MKYALEMEGFDRTSGAGKHILETCSSLTTKNELVVPGAGVEPPRY
jgi:hypothetical protein